eukprot:GHVH01002184.1.p1 GENE.GHVH01002184.1~~GHVH01002184.1.p1  ORF type:complete len:394 (-),score=29.78 GHVH01002184.1:1072-2253(-)
MDVQEIRAYLAKACTLDEIPHENFAPPRRLLPDPENPTSERSHNLQDLVWDFRSPKAKLCISIVLNVEEGGEKPYWQDKLQAGCPIKGPPPLRDLASEQEGEYGARMGFFRIRDLLLHYNLPCTVFAAGAALEKCPAIVDSLKKLGGSPHNWEVASHGFYSMDYAEEFHQEENMMMRLDHNVHEDLLGSCARGYYAGRPSDKTLTFVHEDPDYYYTSDIYNDDVPYWIYREEERDPAFSYNLEAPRESFFPTFPKGKSAHRPLLAIPNSMASNDAILHLDNGIGSMSELVKELTPGIAYMIEETQRDMRPKMMTISLSTKISGQSNAAAYLHELFSYIESMREEGKLVVQTRWEICQNMFTNHYPTDRTDYAMTKEETNELCHPHSRHLKRST